MCKEHKRQSLHQLWELPCWLQSPNAFASLSWGGKPPPVSHGTPKSRMCRNSASNDPSLRVLLQETHCECLLQKSSVRFSFLGSCRITRRLVSCTPIEVTRRNETSKHRVGPLRKLSTTTLHPCEVFLCYPLFMGRLLLTSINKFFWMVETGGWWGHNATFKCGTRCEEVLEAGAGVPSSSLRREHTNMLRPPTLGLVLVLSLIPTVYDGSPQRVPSTGWQIMMRIRMTMTMKVLVPILLR